MARVRTIKIPCDYVRRDEMKGLNNKNFTSAVRNPQSGPRQAGVPTVSHGALTLAPVLASSPHPAQPQVQTPLLVPEP